MAAELGLLRHQFRRTGLCGPLDGREPLDGLREPAAQPLDAGGQAVPLTLQALQRDVQPGHVGVPRADTRPRGVEIPLQRRQLVPFLPNDAFGLGVASLRLGEAGALIGQGAGLLLDHAPAFVAGAGRLRQLGLQLAHLLPRRRGGQACDLGFAFLQGLLELGQGAPLLPDRGRVGSGTAAGLVQGRPGLRQALRGLGQLGVQGGAFAGRLAELRRQLVPVATDHVHYRGRHAAEPGGRHDGRVNGAQHRDHGGRQEQPIMPEQLRECRTEARLWLHGVHAAPTSTRSSVHATRTFFTPSAFA